MIGIGLVGCGHIGTVHSFAVKQLVAAGELDARMVACHDTVPGRAADLARHHDGCRAVTSVDELVASADVVWIATWTAAHREAVEVAVAAGRPVFCEKPLAPNLAECEQLASRLASVPHQVGLVLRFAPVFHLVADLLASGRFGRPLALQLRDDQYFPVQGMYGSTWRGDATKAGGGVLIEHSIHDVDLVRWLWGDPEWVAATVGERSGHPGVEDTAAVMFGFDEGRSASLLTVWHQVLTRPSTRRLEVFCEDAVLVTDDDYLGPLRITTSAGTEVVDGALPEWLTRFTIPEALAKRLGQYAEQVKGFLDALAAGRSGQPDAAVALAAHRLVDAAYRSAEDRGRPIDCERVEGTRGVRDNARVR